MMDMSLGVDIILFSSRRTGGLRGCRKRMGRGKTSAMQKEMTIHAYYAARDDGSTWRIWREKIDKFIGLRASVVPFRTSGIL